MKQIPLTKGLFAIVDDEDYDDLIKYPWFASKSANRFYAKKNPSKGDCKRVRYMHRKILGVEGRNVVIDHINGDSLDNRRCNLRICTHGENIRNRAKYGLKSEYKGIHPKRGKWSCKITVNGVVRNLGVFEDPKDAALAYDKAAVKWHGEFASLNFP